MGRILISLISFMIGLLQLKYLFLHFNSFIDNSYYMLTIIRLINT